MVGCQGMKESRRLLSDRPIISAIRAGNCRFDRTNVSNSGEAAVRKGIIVRQENFL
jgi:hypothetical protein